MENSKICAFKKETHSNSMNFDETKRNEQAFMLLIIKWIICHHFHLLHELRTFFRLLFFEIPQFNLLLLFSYAAFNACCIHNRCIQVFGSNNFVYKSKRTFEWVQSYEINFAFFLSFHFWNCFTTKMIIWIALVTHWHHLSIEHFKWYNVPNMPLITNTNYLQCWRKRFRANEIFNFCTWQY